jgi:hypothetical protein
LARNFLQQITNTTKPRHPTTEVQHRETPNIHCYHTSLLETSKASGVIAELAATDMSLQKVDGENTIRKHETSHPSPLLVTKFEMDFQHAEHVGDELIARN